MREPIPAPDSRRRRTRAGLAGAALIVVVATAGLAAAMVSSLALADQAGTPLTVPGVTVGTQPPATGDAPVVAPSAVSTGAPSVGTVPATIPTTAPVPELVPAPTPVVVDDHGGNRSGGSGGSGSSGSSGKD
ncbi:MULTISPECIES: hypothetical protein [Cryobacterium]|uniref:hypothetical protein n=1 Tax=Cryobacterium TaxID=69578 RepID=UPI00141A7932|nr:MULTISPECIES: hypothetical protein [Cryobacterium]MDY7527393.1 hypothetical protein [Cryobacterium sp. 10C2]MDY7556820.1 hypothetical protein [Cryobacterium sp. 10C3]MEB0004211.1 hypothetical protein [Cryobacterium sp. RTC2.1]MEB0202307.1 hypothetical protein [Cryobacterium sp. 5I3]MEB0286485.1 hypothetical protein [Cryobacterium sp. 10S3]